MRLPRGATGASLRGRSASGYQISDVGGRRDPRSLGHSTPSLTDDRILILLAAAECSPSFDSPTDAPWAVLRRPEVDPLPGTAAGSLQHEANVSLLRKRRSHKQSTPNSLWGASS
jgi:hypothetical protein